MKPFTSYLSASRSELAKVTWPTRAQTVRLTGMVILFSFVFALLLGGIDYIFQTILQKVIVKG